jgi:(R,R)-butanediol dehydrogenase/meso-butanediol dehydrogenase/diacetyl reductase
MLAATYQGQGKIVLAETGVPAPGPGEVQVAVAYTGICGTDLHLVHGGMDERASPPRVVGHEMAGVITTVGTSVDDLRVGDAVAVLPTRTCGTCPACVAGYRNICHRLDFMGIDSDGSMRERWNVPQDCVVVLPPGMDLRAAALVEPTAVAVHDVRRAALRSGERVLVVGGGPIGLLIGCLAAREGTDVVVLEPDDTRRELAVACGLRALDPRAKATEAALAGWTSGAGAAAAFEVSGSQAGLDLAVQSLATRGRLVIVAIHLQPRPVDLHRFFWRELTVTGVRLYDRSDFQEAVTCLAGGAIPVQALISRVEPLREAARAFATAGAGSGVMKVLVDCRENGFDELRG